MKISILTPTYNRAKFLNNLYNSLKKNSKYDIELEWLIIDDGSTDNTKKIIEDFINENKLDIKYYYQENQGKMAALNNLIEKASGDLIIECDSDDFFTDQAFKIIEEEYIKNKDDNTLYAMCFLKNETYDKISGNKFKKENEYTTMFDLYFKQGITGEKVIVFFGNIRNQYRHKLEKNEKFITEARMYHEMDLNYKVKCYNKAIIIGEYQKDGYTNNIMSIFKKYPYGYFEYFKEMFEHSMKSIIFKKRLYIIKHYILFSYLTKEKHILKNVKGIINKILIILIIIPAKIKIKFNKIGDVK